MTDSADNTAVKCVDLKKTYVTGRTETPALRGVNLIVRQGELFMLVGPSGCGKTTLISVIAGILHQSSGECSVFENNLHQMTDRQRTFYRGKHIGFVFQAFNLIPTLTARENVAVPLLIAGASRALAFQRAEELLAKAGIPEKRDSLPSDLSGGQAQRVAIARSLVHNPKLIVCDEPTSSLDADTGHKIMELFREVAISEGRAVIVVTHDSRIFSFADRIAKMNDGVIEKVVNSHSS